MWAKLGKFFRIAPDLDQALIRVPSSRTPLDLTAVLEPEETRQHRKLVAALMPCIVKRFADDTQYLQKICSLPQSPRCDLLGTPCRVGGMGEAEQVSKCKYFTSDVGAATIHMWSLHCARLQYTSLGLQVYPLCRNQYINPSEKQSTPTA